jgi:hypothetical protein
MAAPAYVFYRIPWYFYGLRAIFTSTAYEYCGIDVGGK